MGRLLRLGTSCTAGNPSSLLSIPDRATVAALRTERVVLGPMVTPLARRRPSDVARQATTLDHLSGGRLIFGAGLGRRQTRSSRPLVEDGDARVRADRLDEALAVVCGLWTGESFSFDGVHHQVSDVTFHPPPVQRPRPPIWIAGLLPNRRPFRRAARYEGIFESWPAVAAPPVSPRSSR